MHPAGQVSGISWIVTVLLPSALSGWGSGHRVQTTPAIKLFISLT